MARKKQETPEFVTDVPYNNAADHVGEAEEPAAALSNGPAVETSPAPVQERVVYREAKRKPTFASYILTGINKHTRDRVVIHVGRTKGQMAKFMDLACGVVAATYEQIILYKGRQVS